MQAALQVQLAAWAAAQQLEDGEGTAATADAAAAAHAALPPSATAATVTALLPAGCGAARVALSVRATAEQDAELTLQALAPAAAPARRGPARKAAAAARAPPPPPPPLPRVTLTAALDSEAQLVYAAAPAAARWCEAAQTQLMAAHASGGAGGDDIADAAAGGGAPPTALGRVLCALWRAAVAEPHLARDALLTHPPSAAAEEEEEDGGARMVRPPAGARQNGGKERAPFCFFGVTRARPRRFLGRHAQAWEEDEQAAAAAPAGAACAHASDGAAAAALGPAAPLQHEAPPDAAPYGDAWGIQHTAEEEVVLTWDLRALRAEGGGAAAAALAALGLRSDALLRARLTLPPHGAAAAQPLRCVFEQQLPGGGGQPAGDAAGAAGAAAAVAAAVDGGNHALRSYLPALARELLAAHAAAARLQARKRRREGGDADDDAGAGGGGCGDADADAAGVVDALCRHLHAGVWAVLRCAHARCGACRAPLARGGGGGAPLRACAAFACEAALADAAVARRAALPRLRGRRAPAAALHLALALAAARSVECVLIFHPCPAFLLAEPHRRRPPPWHPTCGAAAPAAARPPSAALPPDADKRAGLSALAAALAALPPAAALAAVRDEAHLLALADACDPAVAAALERDRACGRARAVAAQPHFCYRVLRFVLASATFQARALPHNDDDDDGAVAAAAAADDDHDYDGPPLGAGALLPVPGTALQLSLRGCGGGAAREARFAARVAASGRATRLAFHGAPLPLVLHPARRPAAAQRHAAAGQRRGARPWHLPVGRARSRCVVRVHERAPRRSGSG
jgi:hypothetical protein